MQVNRKLSLNKGWRLHCFSFFSLRWRDKTSVPKYTPLLHTPAGWQDALWQSKFLPYTSLCSFPFNSCLKYKKKKKKSYSASKIPLFVLDGWKSLCRQYSLLNLLFNLIFIFTNISLTASYSHALYNKWFSMLREGAGNARLPSWFFFYCSFAEETKPLQTHPSLLCPLLSTLLYLPDHLDFSKPQTRSHRVCWGKAGYGAHTGDSGWQAAASEFKWKKKWNTHQRVRLQPL